MLRIGDRIGDHKVGNAQGESTTQMLVKMLDIGRKALDTHRYISSCRIIGFCESI